MPFDPLKTHGRKDDETLFLLRDPDQLYTHSEIVALLQRAEDLGFPMEKGSYLNNMTIRELDRLVNLKQ
jgi:hypothetical protein